jgi:hypothetical protein
MEDLFTIEFFVPGHPNLPRRLGLYSFWNE